MTDDNSERNRSTEDDDPEVVRLGGREIWEGASFTLDAAEEFVRHVLEESEGPVTVSEVDQTSGTTVRSMVDNWTAFEEGPKLCEDYFKSFQSDLVKKGYLDFELEDGNLVIATRIVGLRQIA